jgi:hypothetical protein
MSCGECCFPKPAIEINIKDSCNSDCHKSCCCCFSIFKGKKSSKKVEKAALEVMNNEAVDPKPLDKKKVKKKNKKLVGNDPD